MACSKDTVGENLSVRSSAYIIPEKASISGKNPSPRWWFNHLHSVLADLPHFPHFNGSRSHLLDNTMLKKRAEMNLILYQLHINYAYSVILKYVEVFNKTCCLRLQSLDTTMHLHGLNYS